LDHFRSNAAINVEGDDMAERSKAALAMEYHPVEFPVCFGVDAIHD
jgi:hypothetical protein